MLKSYVKYIILSILLFATISVVFQIAVTENPNFSIYDFCINMLSEIAGMIFTVVVFNEFITYRQRLTNLSKSKLLLIELEEFLNNIDFTFRAAVKKYTDKDYAVDLWNSDTFEIIREKIIITEIDNSTFPPVPWYLFFSMQGERLLRKCENIRIQYQDVLDPSIDDLLFYLINDSEILTDLSDIKKIYEVDLLTNYNRPANLGSYFACPTEKDFESIITFNNWLADAKTKMKRSNSLGTRYSKFIHVFSSVLFFTVAVNYFFQHNYFFAVLYAGIAALFCFVAIYNKFRAKK